MFYYVCSVAPNISEIASLPDKNGGVPQVSQCRRPGRAPTKSLPSFGAETEQLRVLRTR